MRRLLSAAAHINIDREAWLRFLIAIGGLALAFAAALFSTVFREAGNLWATAILASFSLLLAGIVALTAVPYLMRRVALERVREAFDYDLTREGIAYSVFILLIAIAALNTGNNLLFIILAAMIAAILVSGIASAAVLRALSLDVVIPEHVFAGTRVPGRITLRNRRRWLPSFSVSVVPPKQGKRRRRIVWQRSTFGLPWKRPRERQWISLPDVSIRYGETAAPRAGIFRGSAYFPFIPARGTASAELELNFERRGRYVQDGFGLATRFPFSFLVKTRRMPLERELIVYPPVEPTDDLFEVLPLITGEFEAFVRGRGFDLYRIREYMPEDSARHVDWKASARSGALMVREFTREDERRLRIVFDNPAPRQVPEAAYEKAVAMAASLAWHFAGEDCDLSFAAPGQPLGTNVYDFLRYLALVAPAEAHSVLDDLPVTDDYNVVITPRPRGSIPTRLWASGYFLFIQ